MFINNNNNNNNNKYCSNWTGIVFVVVFFYHFFSHYGQMLFCKFLYVKVFITVYLYFLRLT